MSGELMTIQSLPEPKPGDVLDGRFALKRALGHGALETVWEGTDNSTSTPYVIKLLPTSSSQPVINEYIQYLQRIHESLAATGTPNLYLPIAQGEAAGVFYQVLRYLPDARSLDQVIRESAPMKPEVALRIIRQVATGLATLHANSIVHADLKPTNILLSGDAEEGTAYVADLGMTRAIETGGGTVLIGTPRYIHPDVLAGKAPGPYVDIYALGLIALAMLTAHPDIPVPLTEAGVFSSLSTTNPAAEDLERRYLDRITNLLFQMLAVGFGREGITAEMVSSIAASLCDDLHAERGVRDRPEPSPFVVREPEPLAPKPVVPKEFAAVLERIQSVLEGLQASTAVLFARAGQLQSAPSPERDERILSEVKQLFTNALARTRTAWRVGLAMTLIAFGVITLMVVSALTLSIATGKSQWALIFGGLSLPVIIGTLIWRPYDRVFRATILTQQIELIHVQTTAGFRGTLNVEERMRICREALGSLQVLFHDHAIPELGSRRGRSKARRSPPPPNQLARL